MPFHQLFPFPANHYLFGGLAPFGHGARHPGRLVHDLVPIPTNQVVAPSPVEEVGPEPMRLGFEYERRVAEGRR
ncbi:MAG: hypothetical protein CME06_03120 [Gemmatimonadetes bacterium]|nr:hypothetical protein [Gemmatimonadota bacterium]